MRPFPSVFCLLLTCLAWSACGPTPVPPLRVAAASNLRPALEALADDFTRTEGTRLELVFASSGKLTAQIRAGAPYDLFLSADERYPAELYTAGLTTSAPVPYARGLLALWTTSPNFNLTSDALLSPAVGRVAMPNPRTAPYGRAARAYLTARGCYARLADKLVFGESVGQTNQFVFSGAADVGLTARSSLTGPQAGGKVVVLGEEWAVAQFAVVLSAAEQWQAAAAFLSYLASDAGRATLRKFGYLTD